MTIEELGRGIGMPAEGMVCAAKHLPALNFRREYRQLLRQDETAFLERLSRQPEANALALALFLDEAAGQKEAWDERGLPENIYFDTMRDLTVWYRECVRRTGAPGLVQWEWLLHSLRGRLVRLGRLQFQPKRLEESLTAGGRVCAAGTPVLGVHIPADGRMEPEAVRDSFRRALEFFRPKEYAAFCCHSWLLSPVLQQLLPSGSNILYFQSLFCIYARDPNDRQTEERVFGAVCDDVSEYPEETSLQKSVKAFLLAGGQTDVGKGILWRETADLL